MPIEAVMEKFKPIMLEEIEIELQIALLMAFLVLLALKKPMRQKAYYEFERTCSTAATIVSDID